MVGRLPGWEARFNAVMEAARNQPYVLGQHDCFRLACRVVEALMGVDRWPAFAGYSTRREALARLAQHGSSFEAAGDWFFGAGNRITPARALRGDIAALLHGGEKHLGVCLSANLALLAPDGLVFLPLMQGAAQGWITAAWRVG